MAPLRWHLRSLLDDAVAIYDRLHDQISPLILLHRSATYLQERVWNRSINQAIYALSLTRCYIGMLVGNLCAGYHPKYSNKQERPWSEKYQFFNLKTNPASQLVGHVDIPTKLLPLIPEAVCKRYSEHCPLTLSIALNRVYAGTNARNLISRLDLNRIECESLTCSKEIFSFVILFVNPYGVGSGKGV